MALFLVLIAALTLWGIKYAGKDQFYQDYLEKDCILAIKGIFILFVFATHFSQYVSYTSILSKPYILFRKLSGQMIVVPFLFYSGYGIAASLREKGYPYLRSMPGKRILRVLVQFDIAVLLYYLTIRLMGGKIGLGRLLLSFVAWRAIGNSTWYILAILLLYLISYCVGMGLSEGGRFTRGKEAGWIIAVLSLCLIWILKETRPATYSNTILAYPFGFLYYQYKDKIESFVFRSDRTFVLLLGTLFALIVVFRLNWKLSFSAYLVSAVIFAGIVAMLTAKFRVTNAILRYCGEHLFSLYILQRLPMLVLSRTALVNHIPVYFFCSLVITFLLSWLFDQTVPRLWGRQGKQ